MGSNALKTILPIALGLAVPGIGSALGLGALGSAGLGAGVGALSSKLTGGNALIGALSGGAGAGLSGLSGLGGASSGLSSAASGLAGQSGGILSGLGSTGGGLTSALGGISSYAKPAVQLFSGISSSNAQDKMKDQLLAAQGNVQNALSPYTTAGGQAAGQLSNNLSAGFNPGDLTNDPGYQFQLQQGNQNLNRQLSANGMTNSGAALKAAQDYGQGLAGQTYGDAYNRWLQGNSQLQGLTGTGLNAANGLGESYANQGNINAGNTLAQSNIMNGTLSGLLGGNSSIGFDSTGNPLKTVIGYRQDGTPIYG